MKNNYYSPINIYNTDWKNTKEKISPKLIDSFYQTKPIHNDFYNNAAAVQIGDYSPVGALSNKFDKSDLSKTTSLGHSEPRVMLNAIKRIPLPHSNDNYYGLLYNARQYNENYNDLNKFYEATDKYKDYFTKENTPVRLLSERTPCTPYSGRDGKIYQNPGCSSFLDKILPNDNQVGYTADTAFKTAFDQANTVKAAFDQLKQAYNTYNNQFLSSNNPFSIDINPSNLNNSLTSSETGIGKTSLEKLLNMSPEGWEELDAEVVSRFPARSSDNLYRLPPGTEILIEEKSSPVSWGSPSITSQNFREMDNEMMKRGLGPVVLPYGSQNSMIIESVGPSEVRRGLGPALSQPPFIESQRFPAHLPLVNRTGTYTPAHISSSNLYGSPPGTGMLIERVVSESPGHRIQEETKEHDGYSTNKPYRSGGRVHDDKKFLPLTSDRCNNIHPMFRDIGYNHFKQKSKSRI